MGQRENLMSAKLDSAGLMDRNMSGLRAEDSLIGT